MGYHPYPIYINIPYIMFVLHEILDELDRSNLSIDDLIFSYRDAIFDYICVNLEKTNKIILPEKLLQVLTSTEFKEFENPYFK